jgi:uracil-DNA glycosylase
MSNDRIQLEYQPLKEEIEAFVEDFRSDEATEKKVDKYYKGVQVFFSPLIFQPRIMFIGINPGAGFYNWEKRLVKRYSPLVNNEYYYSDYRLAKQTQKLFELSGLGKEELKNTVKINCFFFASKNQKELYQMLSHLESKEVYSKSARWTDQLVDLIQPEIIICEGKSAFDRFIENKDISSTIGTENFWYTTYGNRKVLGYRRNFSNICKIEEVAKELKNCLKS